MKFSVRVRIVAFLAVFVVVAVAMSGVANDSLSALDKALCQAIKRGSTEDVKSLIKKGANVNLKLDGKMPLVFAVITDSSIKINMLSLLIESGMNVNAKFEILTPLDMVLDDGNDDVVKLLIQAGADVNIEDDEGRTVLHKMVGRGKFDIVALLIKHGANVNATGKKGLGAGLTPLHAASSNRTSEEGTKIAKLLIDSGAKVNAKTTTGGFTPLMLAANSQKTLEIVELLIKNGADVNVIGNVTGTKFTALDLARESNNRDVEKLLLSNGGKSAK